MLLVRSLLLIRHPEAKKNMQDRHGGAGSTLTKKGLQQCKCIAKFIKSYEHSLENALLVGHRVHQVFESVNYLGNELYIKPVFEERLKGIDMGELAGLSRTEAAEQWPEAANRLELWREGQLKINELKMPGGECVDKFKFRIEKALFELLSQKTYNPLLIVATRSTLIMILNLLILGDNFSFYRYKPYHFDLGSISIFTLKSSRAKLLTLNDTQHLSYEKKGQIN